MPTKNKQSFDIVIIGGGPAGMMAAGRAAELGARVALLEKNEELGKKLLLTGNGRCNIAQENFEYSKLGRKGKFIFNADYKFPTQGIVSFFKSLKIDLKSEKEGRMFPVSDKSRDVLNSLVGYLKENNVTILKGAKIKNFLVEGKKIIAVNLKNQTIEAKKFIICTGGKSYPQTGSTGDGYSWAKKMGHKIIPLRPIIVPIKINEDWIKYLQGTSVRKIELSVIQGKKVFEKHFGQMLFTHFGISGPMVLNLSKRIGELLENGDVILSLDLKPYLDYPQLDERIRENWEKSLNKLFRNSLENLIPEKMIPLIIKKSGINPEKKVNSITKEERKKLVHAIKNIPLQVQGLLGFKSAMLTGGGVDLAEIDPKTMKSKIIDNLYFAGEIIDLDGPTGGYNLQICWTTGRLAGESAALDNNGE